jgi:hypothetical protein
MGDFQVTGESSMVRRPDREIAKLRLLVGPTPGSTIPERALADLALTLGLLLLDVGENGVDPQPFVEARGLFQRVLAVWDRESSPQKWARVRNRMAHTYASESERGGNPAEGARLAIPIFKEALGIQERQDTSSAVAMTLLNLCAAQHQLGNATNDVQALSDGVASCSRALAMTTDRPGIGVARANYCNVTGNLAIRLKDRTLLQEALASCREALTIAEDTHAPLMIVAARDNLGSVQHALGDMDGGNEPVCEGLRNHLVAWSQARGRSPMWAKRAATHTQVTLNHLAKSLRPEDLPSCVGSLGTLLAEYRRTPVAGPEAVRH